MILACFLIVAVLKSSEGLALPAELFGLTLYIIAEQGL